MEQLIPAPEGMELNTPETARAYFETRGISIASWCRNHDLNRNAVAALISPNGKSAGRRGKAFAAAVALGLRHPPPADCSNDEE